MRILWLSHEANISGANLCLKEFMQIASELNYEQLLILPHEGNMETLAEELNVQSKIIHYYPWTRQLHDSFFNWSFVRRFLRNFIGTLQLAKIIYTHKIDLVFTNTSVINIGAFAAFLTRRRHFWYVHEMGEEDFGIKLSWGKISYWFMNRFSDKVLTNSNHLAKKYKSKFSSFKIEILRYPVNVPQIKDTRMWNDAETIQLLLIGQVIQSKGHMVALNAIKEITEQGKKVKLNIVGKIEDEKFKSVLFEFISDNKLENHIQFIDFTSTPHFTIADNHILLMCSKCEAFGRVTIEAMKLGVPVIGSATCGTLEIIEDKKTGLLFNQGDGHSLAEKILILIHDEELRENIISFAKQQAYQMCNKVVVSEFFKNQLN